MHLTDDIYGLDTAGSMSLRSLQFLLLTTHDFFSGSYLRTRFVMKGLRIADSPGDRIAGLTSK